MKSSGQPPEREQTPAAASRFAFHGDNDDPGEGGVRSVATGNKPFPTERHVSGAPGPEERLLDISELARTVGMRYTHRFHLPPRSVEDLEAVTPLAGTVTLTNTGPILLLRGDVSTALRLECGRCLEPTVQEVSAELEEEFDLIASRNAFHQEEVQAVDEDTPAAVIQNNVLDLGDLLRQNLLLAAPLQPLCREECTGIDLTARTTSVEENGASSSDNPLRRLAELMAAEERQD